jgi:hypothetical protein
VAGAVVTLLSQYLMLALPSAVPGLAVAAPLCCCGASLPLGAVASWLAWRRDPTLTPGQGFTVAFIACGLGAAVTAFIMIMQMGPEFRAEFERAARESLAKMSGSNPQMTPEEMDRMAERVAAWAPYVPPLGALLSTLLSAVGGVVAVVVMRGRQQLPT